MEQSPSWLARNWRALWWTVIGISVVLGGISAAVLLKGDSDAGWWIGGIGAFAFVFAVEFLVKGPDHLDDPGPDYGEGPYGPP